MLRWIFFDLGGTLLDDIPFHDLINQTLLNILAEHGYNVGKDEFIRARDALVVKRVPVLSSLVVYFTGGDELKDPVMKELMRRIDHKGPELQFPFPESDGLLRSLRERFSLGVIANQQVEVHDLLGRLCWDRLFDVTIISDEVGLWKPDPRIFEMALKEAACKPQEAAMVGDRIDNDVAPAKHLGMRAIRIKWGVFGPQEASSEFEVPDAEIAGLDRLPAVLARLR